jgi:hypothetical protein
MIAVGIRWAAVLTSTLAVTAIVALPAPARAVVDGIDVRITDLPAEFEAGADARTVEVVAAVERARGRERCRKVRWSLLVQVDGPRLDQVRVDRIEEGRSFPVRARAEGDTARFTDVRTDPGRLCPGRTVTARYRVAFDAGAATGEVAFQAQAFGADDRLLQAASGASRVDGAGPTPSPSPSASPSEPESAGAEDEAAPAATPSAPGLSAASNSDGTPSLLGPGLIAGGLLVFLGVGLVLRIRVRNRRARHGRRATPAGLHPAP